MKTMDFSETVAVSDLKLGRSRVKYHCCDRNAFLTMHLNNCYNEASSSLFKDAHILSLHNIARLSLCHFYVIVYSANV